MKEIQGYMNKISQRNRMHMSEPPSPLLRQELHLLKQKEMPAKLTQVWAVTMEPATLIEKRDSHLQLSPIASVDKEAGKPLHGDRARSLTELMKASPLGSMSMSSEPVSARQR